MNQLEDVRNNLQANQEAIYNFIKDPNFNSKNFEALRNEINASIMESAGNSAAILSELNRKIDNDIHPSIQYVRDTVGHTINNIIMNNVAAKTVHIISSY